MTFAAQRRLAAAIGLAASLLAAVAAVLAMLFAPDKGSRGDAFWAVVILLPTGIAALFLMFGVLMRTIQRWLWFTLKFKESYPRYHQRIVTGWASGFWRWWLHIDENGDDLDRR